MLPKDIAHSFSSIPIEVFKMIFRFFERDYFVYRSSFEASNDEDRRGSSEVDVPAVISRNVSRFLVTKRLKK